MLFAWLTLHKSQQALSYLWRFTLKKALAKEKDIIQLNSVFFINITKDLCYFLMNMAFEKNSVIGLKICKNWCLHDDHYDSTCASVTELSKGTVGKIKNTIKNNWKVPPITFQIP